MRSIDNYSTQAEPVRGNNSGRRESLGKLADWLFNCRHSQMSWPQTVDGQTYRVCMYCGARRRFIPESWKTVGSYYRDPVPNAGARTQAASVPVAEALMGSIGGRPAGSSRSLYLRASTRLRGFFSDFVAALEGRRSQVRE